MIVWVYRGPPLMGGTMTYSAHGGLTIPIYIYRRGYVSYGSSYGIPYRGLQGPYREIGGMHRCAYLRPTL